MKSKIVQMTVFGVEPDQVASFSVFHDESGTDLAHDRFQLHGALFVPMSRIQPALQILKNYRNGYDGQIHFVKLRDNSSSQMSLVADKWLRAYFSELSNYCFYKCMILDMQSPTFEKAKLEKPHIIYNQTALLSIYSGVVWFLRKYDNVVLSIYSESMSRKASDNFDEYLPRELARKAGNNKKCPKVVIPLEKVICVNGDPRKADSTTADHCEFIQLTDLLTGAVSQAINAKASQEVKIDLGKMVAEWIGDTCLPPWIQKNELHRRFSVSCTDGIGNFYDVPIKILLKNQLTLPFT